MAGGDLKLPALVNRSASMFADSQSTRESSENRQAGLGRQRWSGRIALAYSGLRGDGRVLVGHQFVERLEGSLFVFAKRNLFPIDRAVSALGCLRR